MTQKEKCNLENDMAYTLDTISIFRKLCEQHIMWTRSYMISCIEELDDLDAVRNRLLRNPSDFAYELAPFYGEITAHQFMILLREHLFITFDLLNSVRTNNIMVMNESKNKWYSNTENMAIFLASINPYWEKEHWQVLFFEYLNMIEDTVALRFSKRHPRGVTMYDDLEEHALKMADYMWKGIIHQFQI